MYPYLLVLIRTFTNIAVMIRLLEETDPARALKLYLDALDTFESADHCDRKASDTIRKALSLVLSNNK